MAHVDIRHKQVGKHSGIRDTAHTLKKADEDEMYIQWIHGAYEHGVLMNETRNNGGSLT